MFAFLPAAISLLGDHVEDYASFPEAASSFASDNDWIYGFITWICIVFFIGIAGSLFYFAWKYNKPKGEQAESDISHNTPLELPWSILPFFVLVVMFMMGVNAFLDIRDVPEGANDIGVQASKWNWAMDYGGGTIHNELHVLLNKPTKLSMRSSDVIHSLYVPAFRAKKDIVPGRYNYMWFKPTVATDKVSDEDLAEATKALKGQDWDYDKYQFTPDGYEFYDLYCAEYCGKDHSEMQTVVVVHEKREDLDAWIKKYSERDPSVPPAVYGEALYKRRGCSGCHTVDGKKLVGPSFSETFGKKRAFVKADALTADENYLRQSILYPKEKVVAGYQPVMPSYKGQLSDDDLYSIVEYLKTLSDAPKGSGDTATETDAKASK